MNFDLGIIDSEVGYRYFSGSDEVGRGPLAGPLVAASILYDSRHLFAEEDLHLLYELGVTDSKALTKARRQEILREIGLNYTKVEAGVIIPSLLPSFYFSVNEVSVEEVDKLNILQASLLGMKNSVTCLNKDQHKILCLIDGQRAPKMGPLYKTMPIIKGDSKSLLIGAASILAKEYRDHLMGELDKKYPVYGFAKHAGYPTAFHREMIKEYGVTGIHRRTFKGVSEFLCKKGKQRK